MPEPLNMPDTLSVELEISDSAATVKIDRFTNSLHSLNSDINKVGKNAPFAKKLASDFAVLEKKSNDVRKSFQSIQATRLDSGNIGHLTREIVVAHERARQLSFDISQIKSELANPNRKSSIKFLTEELKAAETEADRLNRKLNSLPANNSRSGGRASSGGGRRGRITDAQATFLEFADDFAPEGMNRAFNAAGRAIFAAQNAKDAAKELSLLSGVSLSTLATFGAIAAVGVGIVQITQNIRAEAERRLKVEEGITGAINRQRISQKEALEDLKNAERDAQSRRMFARELETGSVDDLRTKRDTIKRLAEMTPKTLPTLENGKVVSKPNETFQKLSQQLDSLNAQIIQTGANKQSIANDAFNQRWESWKKSQENALEAEKKHSEFLKKQSEDIEKAKTKVKELEKQYLSTFDRLFQKSGAENPFVAVFSDGDKALRDLRENLKGLPTEVQAIAVALQQKLNLKALLAAKFDNQLSVFDLRESAQNFRNPFDADKQKKDQDEFVKDFLGRNPNYLFLQGKRTLDDETRQKILNRFAPSSLTETAADRFNKSLDEKFNLLYKPGQTADQIAAADKRFISLTAGANPLDLNRNLREQAAIVREREALRQERYQQDAIALYRQQLAAQQQIADNTKNQNKIAERGGTKAIELTVKDERNSGSVELQPAATSKATENAYRDDDSFYAPSPFGINKNGSNR